MNLIEELIETRSETLERFEFDKVAMHNRNHLDQITVALAGGA